MGQDETERRLTILVVDDHGELLAHARSEFTSDHVVRVGTAAAAHRALGQISFDIVLCRPRDLCRLPADERIMPIGRPLSADQVIGIVSHAMSRRARRKRHERRPAADWADKTECGSRSWAAA